MSLKIKTTKLDSVFSKKTSKELYKYFKKNINWNDYKTKTSKRMAGTISSEDAIVSNILDVVLLVVKKLVPFKNFTIPKEIWLNYYRDGNDSTPSHKHENTIQVIVSFSASRNLKVSSKFYRMRSGDVAIFGSSLHSVPLDNETKKGRISFAFFILPLY